MSSVSRKVHRLERFRKAHKGSSAPVAEGRGKSVAREAKIVAIKAAVSLKKKSSKPVRELEGLSVAELKAQLEASRKELFNLRFKHATAQLTDVASMPAAKRRIARILTLIKQKEVGA